MKQKPVDRCLIADCGQLEPDQDFGIPKPIDGDIYEDYAGSIQFDLI